MHTQKDPAHVQPEDGHSLIGAGVETAESGGSDLAVSFGRNLHVVLKRHETAGYAYACSYKDGCCL
jgi:hypothetical protein